MLNIFRSSLINIEYNETVCSLLFGKMKLWYHKMYRDNYLRNIIF